MTPEELAQRFHETYERLAPEFGYKTREASAVPWAEVPAQNKALMIAVCARILPSTPVAAQGQEMPEPYPHLVGLFNLYTHAKRGLLFSKRWLVVNAMEKAMIAAEAGVAASQPTTDKEK